MAKKLSELPVANALDGTETLALVQAGVTRRALAGALISPGYIDGLKLGWVSGTALSVSSGTAYVPGLGRMVIVTADLSRTGIALTASSWYHVYLFVSVAGAASIEIVTTAPAAPYNGTARTKAGDTSRRYLGSVLTDAHAAIWTFVHDGHHLHWITAIGVAGNFRALAVGTAVTDTVVSLAAYMPATAQQALVRLSNTAPLGQPTTKVGALGTLIFSVDATQSVYVQVPTDGAQNVIYAFTSAPASGGLYIDVFGYVAER